MRHVTYRTMLLVPALVLVSAWTCGEKPRPQVGLSPPVNLLNREPEPATPIEALTSDEAANRSNDAKIEWGRQNAGIIDRACQWLVASGVKLDCSTKDGS